MLRVESAIVSEGLPGFYFQPIHISMKANFIIKLEAVSIQYVLRQKLRLCKQ